MDGAHSYRLFAPPERQPSADNFEIIAYIYPKFSEMDNETIKFIDKIEIKGLWGRYNIDWQLNQDVNILVGENGTGKSTIIEWAYTILEQAAESPDELFHHRYSNGDNPPFIALNVFWDNQLLVYTQLKDQYGKKDNSGFQTLTITPNNIDFNFRIDFISTFDTILNNYEPDSFTIKNKPHIKTHLDQEFDYHLSKYVEYQLNKTNQIFRKELTTEKAFEKKEYFTNTVNRLFSATNKKLDPIDNKISFISEDNTKIQWYQLSSGEKQLLIILLTVLCQDEAPSVLLLDEPEISLHLRWQYEFIEILRTLNPHCQIILATHSPSLFSDGWRNKVFWLDKIRSRY